MNDNSKHPILEKKSRTLFLSPKSDMKLETKTTENKAKLLAPVVFNSPSVSISSFSHLTQPVASTQSTPSSQSTSSSTQSTPSSSTLPPTSPVTSHRKTGSRFSSDWGKRGEGGFPFVSKTHRDKKNLTYSIPSSSTPTSVPASTPTSSIPVPSSTKESKKSVSSSPKKIYSDHIKNRSHSSCTSSSEEETSSLSGSPYGSPVSSSSTSSTSFTSISSSTSSCNEIPSIPSNASIPIMTLIPLNNLKSPTPPSELEKITSLTPLKLHPQSTQLTQLTPSRKVDSEKEQGEEFPKVSSNSTSLASLNNLNNTEPYILENNDVINKYNHRRTYTPPTISLLSLSPLASGDRTSSPFVSGDRTSPPFATGDRTSSSFISEDKSSPDEKMYSHPTSLMWKISSGLYSPKFENTSKSLTLFDRQFPKDKIESREISVDELKKVILSGNFHFNEDPKSIELIYHIWTCKNTVVDNMIELINNSSNNKSEQTGLRQSILPSNCFAKK